jgi:RNA-dependent RNA polymerase
LYLLSVVTPVAEGHDPDRAPSEATMTDGCGFINGSALSLICRAMSLEYRPSAVQGRIAGSKGVWILHPTDRSPSEPRRIWIRGSQKKIEFENLDDRGHRIFNFVAPPRLTSHRMTMQSIVNLSHNGVGDEVFKTLLTEALSAEVKQITDWDGPHAMLALWRAIHQQGVGRSRLQRHSQGATRALGLAGREIKEQIATSINVEVDEPHVACSSRDLYSGAPLSLHESALEMLQAGFHPLKSKALYEKLRNVLTCVIDSHIKEYRIGVLRSAEVFIVPGDSVFCTC